MANAKAFLDTNILLYVFSGDTVKADMAEQVLSRGGFISVQVLNEFASVAHRKMDMSFSEIRAVLLPIQQICQTVSLHSDTHTDALWIAEKFGFNFWDALIVASAFEADCTLLYTEDLQHGQIVAERLRIVNPFQEHPTTQV